LPTIKHGNEITTLLLNEGKYGDDLLKTAAIKDYFQNYFQAFLPEMKYPAKNKPFDLSALLAYSKSYWMKLEKKPPLVIKSSAKTIAKYFLVIENQTTAVIVPYGKGKDLISKLNGSLPLEVKYKLLKRAQLYIANVFDNEKNELEKLGAIHRIAIGEEEILTLNPVYYNKELGLDLTGRTEMEISIY
jgi:CRISPR-associated endonuclease/helicase Cas3